VEQHLELKDFLLNPKMGDKATTWFYVDGLRLCDISIGRKYVFVKPLHGNYVKKKHTIRKAKEILKNMYWQAASTDAYYKALESGRKRKPKNWEKSYV
jgi:hypothetical protein|tara:strand:+ start:1072 stop:1365 length:294 start_codon:yes stop_codon:yes gene_type:complete